MIRPKPGDHVLHRPSGETRTVAVADPKRDALVACGWPCAIERLSDCEVILEVSDEESRQLAAEIAGLHGDQGELDIRASWVKRLYPELFSTEDPRP